MIEETKKTLAETVQRNEAKKRTQTDAEKAFKLRFTRLLAETVERKPKKTETPTSSESGK
jgi:hypothetical protein